MCPLPRKIGKESLLSVEVSHLENERVRSAGAGRPVRGKKRTAKVEVALAEPLKKLAAAEWRAKKLDVNVLEPGSSASKPDP